MKQIKNKISKEMKSKLSKDPSEKINLKRVGSNKLYEFKNTAVSAFLNFKKKGQILHKITRKNIDKNISFFYSNNKLIN